MAILKRITDLDPASQPLGGTELAELSQGGVSKKVSLANILGANWWAPLRAAFSSFVAPEATHAIDSDTVGGETKAQLHDATKLTGAVPLANIPAELTGKNAATATLVGGMKRKYLPIGAWNMNTISDVAITHEVFGGASKIVGANVVIFNDSLTFSVSIFTQDSGYFTCNSSVIRLYRASVGVFTGIDFSSTAVNRGYIVIDYID